MRIKTATSLLIGLLSVPNVFGQSHIPAAGRGAQSLNSACEGAWLRIESTVASLSHMRNDALDDRAERTRVTCLLDAIDKTTFDADPQMNAVYTSVAVSTLVGVYGPAGYDFFASEFPEQTLRVQQALDAALFGRGHPDAVRRYFEKRRSTVARGESQTQSMRATPAVWGSVIERGTCSAELCSSRIEETLEIVRRNLDIVDADLAAAESLTSEASEQAAKTRKSAQHLREIIGRIRRGEVAFGGRVQ